MTGLKEQLHIIVKYQKKFNIDVDKHDKIITKLKDRFLKEKIEIKSYKDKYSNGDVVVTYKIENDVEKWFINEVSDGQLIEIEEIEVQSFFLYYLN